MGFTLSRYSIRKNHIGGIPVIQDHRTKAQFLIYVCKKNDQLGRLSILVSYWICKGGDEKYTNIDNNCVIKDAIMIV